MGNGSDYGHFPEISGVSEPPTFEALTGDLKTLRERGLVRLRGLGLDALQRAARAAGYSALQDADPPAQESLVRDAVARLGDGFAGQAAEYLFGLVRGTAGWKPKDLRERAASFYGVTGETFRKEPERLLIGQVAEQVLNICHAHAARRQGPGAEAESTIIASADRSDAWVASGKPFLGLSHPESDSAVLRGPRSDPTTPASRITLPSTAQEIRTYGPYRYQLTDGEVLLSVRGGTVDALSDIDILVASENTYFALPAAFKASLSARLRATAARRNEAGEIVDDVVGREVGAWLARHGRSGLPVETGTVFATESGELARRRIRRIYHAAVVTPRPGTNAYDVEPSSVFQVIRNSVELARRESPDFAPPLRSICFPLLGAGRGGLDPLVSASWIWSAVAGELGDLVGWHVHFMTRRVDGTLAVLEQLHRAASGNSALEADLRELTEG